MGQYWADDYTRLMHVVVLSIFSFLALVAVIFRLWSRKIQRMRGGLNDCLCTIGFVRSVSTYNPCSGRLIEVCQVFALALSIFTIYGNSTRSLALD